MEIAITKNTTMRKLGHDVCKNDINMRLNVCKLYGNEQAKW